MNFYLDKYGFCPPNISSEPHAELGIIIVIPCHNEPDLIHALKAITEAQSPNAAVEVMIVINAGEQADERIKRANEKSHEQGLKFSAEYSNDRLKFHFLLHQNLPRKHAGVGLARKIGMDEAVSRFHQLDKDGIIVCFDADASCAKNYLVAIESHFEKHPKTPGCSIFYEHPLHGKQFDLAVYQGIINYELHLRYYKLALEYAGLPYAYHTVGSSMAVRSSAYQKQGGMNKRKAGEDFYFIHKIIALGNFTALKSTRVIPSPRVSDRVPFGTGKAIGDWLEKGVNQLSTYAFDSFEIIKSFVDKIDRLYTVDLDEIQFNLSKNNHQLLATFLDQNNFNKALVDIRKNATNTERFKKRFFVWFNAFFVLKFVHYLRDEAYPNQPIEQEVLKLNQQLMQLDLDLDPLNQLLAIRTYEKDSSQY